MEQKNFLRDINKIREYFIWKINYDDEYIHLSPRVKNLLGYESEEMLFKKFYSFMPQDESERVAKKIAIFKEELRSYWNLECCFLKKDNKLIMIEMNAVVVLDENNNICGYEGVAYVLNDQKSEI